jgi:hypothetical protein
MNNDLRYRFGFTDHNLACYTLDLAGYPDESDERAAVLRHAAETAARRGRGLTESVRDVLEQLACCRAELRVAPRMLGELTTRGDAMTYTHPSGMEAVCCIAPDVVADETEVLLDEVQAWRKLDGEQLDALAEEVTRHVRVVLTDV